LTNEEEIVTYLIGFLTSQQIALQYVNLSRSTKHNARARVMETFNKICFI